MSQRRLSKTNGRFEVGEGDDLSYLAYEFDGREVISLLPTQVPQPLRGRGIAGNLARMAFKFAETKDLRVEVICPIVYHFLTKNPEYRKQVQLPSLDGAVIPDPMLLTNESRLTSF